MRVPYFRKLSHRRLVGVSGLPSGFQVREHGQKGWRLNGEIALNALIPKSQDCLDYTPHTLGLPSYTLHYKPFQPLSILPAVSRAILDPGTSIAVLDGDRSTCGTCTIHPELSVRICRDLSESFYGSSYLILVCCRSRNAWKDSADAWRHAFWHGELQVWQLPPRGAFADLGVLGGGIGR